MAQKTDVITKYSYLIGQTINKWTILEILKIWMNNNWNE